MEEKKNISQSQNFNNAIISGAQIGQSNGNLYQNNINQGAVDDRQLNPRVIANLIENLRLIINNSELSDNMIGKCDRHLQTFQDEVLEKKPNKDYAAQTLQRVLSAIKDTEKVTTASLGLIDKMQPVITRIVPWLGEAKKFLRL